MNSAGTAWGEWGKDEIEKLVGYIPQGLEKLSGLWRAPMRDYAIIPTIIGIIATIIIMLVIGRMLAKKGD